MNSVFKYFISLFKTIYFNFKVFNFKTAIKLPIFVSYNTKILEINKNSIDIKCKVKPALIKIGFGGTDFIPSQKGIIKIEKGSKICFYGKTFLAEGTCISLEKSSEIIFGNNFASNKNCIFHSCKSIKFGNDVLVGWNVNFRDNDGHTIFNGEALNDNEKEVLIKDHVWIASYVDILKGVTIEKKSVVATRSCVTKKIDEENVLIGWYPAKIIKENISWKK